MLNGHVIIAIYVNNMLLFGKSLKEVKIVKALIARKFQVKDLGEASVCLGIHISRDRKNRILRIDQSAYMRNVVRRFQQSNSPGISTPMAIDAQFTLAEEGNEFKALTYQEAVGSLMHLLHTHLELAFAVGKVSQFSLKPRMNHWTAIIRIL